MEQPVSDHAMLRLVGALLDGSHLARPDELPDVIERAGDELDWIIGVWLIDYEQRQLVELGHANEGVHEPQPVDGSLAGRSFRMVEPVRSSIPEPHLWVPLLDGVERLGVLRLQSRSETIGDDEGSLTRIRWLAHLVAHLIAGKSAFADTYHRTRLTSPRSVPSELIWSMLPPLTVACRGLVIAGALEPTHSVAGDIFDYSIDDGTAHIAIADATGHDVTSAAIGALTLAAYRSGRRQMLGLVDTAELIDATLAGYAPDTFATGIVGQLDIESGTFSYLNAGHPAPLLLRDGRVVKTLEEGRRILLGIEGHTAAVAHEHLQPGDWIILYTDGVPEARDDDRHFFGMDRFIDVIERCAADGQPAVETLRRVTHAVLNHQRGVLQDDATLVAVQWESGSEEQLRSS